MTYQINCMQEEGYLHVNVSGIRNKANVAQAAVKILKKAVEHNSPLVLVDVCKFEGKLSMLESISVILNLFPKIRKERFLKKALIVDDRKKGRDFVFLKHML